MLKQIENPASAGPATPTAEATAGARVARALAGLRARVAFSRADLAPFVRNTRHWWRNQALARAARRDLAALGDLPAAEALWALNRLAKNSHRRAQIYALKTVAVRAFHARHPSKVHLHRQELRCWGEDGYGCGPDCYRCGGTRIYRTVRLLLFRFTIEGRHFAWHQPERLVDWPVELAGEEGDWQERGPVAPPAVDVERLLAVLRVYLVEAAGLALPPEAVPTNARLREALAADGRHLRWRAAPALDRARAWARARGRGRRPMWRERPVRVEPAAREQ